MLKQSIIKLCGEITALSVFITNITENEVFTRYSAHVNKFEVEIFMGGWNNDDKSNQCRIEIWLEGDLAEKELISIKEKLETILSEIYTIEDLERGEGNN